MDEIHVTTHDEYGLRANGLLHTLELFDTFFGLMLGYHLFGAAKNVSLTLQRKKISLQDALWLLKLQKAFTNECDQTNNLVNFIKKV